MDPLHVEREGGVARVWLARERKANALNGELLEALAACFEVLKADAGLRVVVLGGRGNSFCAGADINEMAALDVQTARAFIRKIHYVCRAIRQLPVPVLARLHGAVVGAGLEIAAACDLRMAAADARFAMPEVRFGIPSVVEAALLPRLVGSGRAAWLVLTGEWIDAAKAAQWGLVEEVASLHGLDEAVSRTSAALLAGEREALRVQKELAQLWDEAPLADSIAASVERFAQSYAAGIPNKLMKR